MAESFPSTGPDLPSPTLSARLRELAAYLAAPTAGHLTEEQRALSLGIARRLVTTLAAELDVGIDVTALWDDWLAGGIPSAERLAPACFARGEEHRWRQQSAQSAPTVSPGTAETADGLPAAGESELSDTDRAFLALRIADRRRFDALGNPAIAVADLDPDLLRALLLDIAAWWLARDKGDGNRAAALGDAVRTTGEAQQSATGIDAEAKAYHAILIANGDLSAVAAGAIARHDWTTLVALAAAAGKRRYADMALALITAEAAALPVLLAPLRLDSAALAPLEASLAMLPARALAGDDAGSGATA